MGTDAGNKKLVIFGIIVTTVSSLLFLFVIGVVAEIQHATPDAAVYAPIGSIAIGGLGGLVGLLGRTTNTPDPTTTLVNLQPDHIALTAAPTAADPDPEPAGSPVKARRTTPTVNGNSQQQQQKKA